MDIQVLVFKVDACRFGIVATQVERVHPAAEIAPLPDAPPAVAGVINIQGIAIPALDLRRPLGLGPTQPSLDSRLIVVNRGPDRLAVLADEVIGIVALPEDVIVGAEALVPGAGRVSGVATVADGLILVQDAAQLLTATEARTLEAALAKKEAMMEAADPLASLATDRLGLKIPESQRDRLDRAWQAARTVVTGSTSEALAILPLESEAWQKAIPNLTVGETYFFRQRGWFSQIETQILAPLIAERRAAGQRRIALWSAGCASGDEAYTLALLLDRLIPDRADWQIRLLASDVNGEALDLARAAIYRPWALRELDEAERERYFVVSEDRRYRLVPAIRDMVEFRFHNLADPWLPSGGFDLVICRNVLMYLTPDCQRAVCARLRKALAPRGWLAVSAAEAVADWHRPLVPVNLPEAIFFHDSPAPPPRAKPKREPDPITPSPPPRPARRKPAPPAPPGDALPQARRLADQGHLDDAKQLCETAIRDDRLDGEAQLLLSSICEELGDLSSAHAAARRAAYLVPDSALAHFRLGSLLSALGRSAQARRSMETVLQILDRLPAEVPVGEVGAGVLREAAAAFLTGPAGGERADG